MLGKENVVVLQKLGSHMVVLVMHRSYYPALAGDLEYRHETCSAQDTA